MRNVRTIAYPALETRDERALTYSPILQGGTPLICTRCKKHPVAEAAPNERPRKRCDACATWAATRQRNVTAERRKDCRCIQCGTEVGVADEAPSRCATCTAGKAVNYFKNRRARRSAA